MVFNSQVIQYGSPAWVAGNVHRAMCNEGVDVLEKIAKKLPEGTEAIVKFMVAATLSRSSYANGPLQIRHIVWIHLEKTASNKLKVITASRSGVTSGTIPGILYADRLETPELQQPRQTKAQESEQPSPLLEGTSEEKDQSGEVTNPPSQFQAHEHIIFDFGSEPLVPDLISIDQSELIPSLHPLMNNSDRQSLAVLYERSQPEYRELYQFVFAVDEIFRFGIPLPNIQPIDYRSLTVMLRVPNNGIQSYVTAMNTTTFSRESHFGEPKAHHVLQKAAPETTNGVTKLFQTLRTEAQGQFRPIGIPRNTIWLQGNEEKTQSSADQTPSSVQLHVNKILAAGGTTSQSSNFGRLEILADISPPEAETESECSERSIGSPISASEEETDTDRSTSSHSQ